MNGQSNQMDLADSLILKYGLTLDHDYNFDSIRLKNLYLADTDEQGVFFIDFYGNRHSKNYYEEIKLVGLAPVKFFWGKTEGKWDLYHFPEKILYGVDLSIGIN